MFSFFRIFEWFSKSLIIGLEWILVISGFVKRKVSNLICLFYAYELFNKILQFEKNFIFFLQNMKISCILYFLFPSLLLSSPSMFFERLMPTATEQLIFESSFVRWVSHQGESWSKNWNGPSPCMTWMGNYGLSDALKWDFFILVSSTVMVTFRDKKCWKLSR